MKTVRTKVFILLFVLLSMFFVGCEANKKDDLYIDIEEEIFITETKDVNVYSKGELISWEKLDYTLSDYKVGEIIDGKFVPKDYGKVTITVLLKDNPTIYISKDVKIVPPYVRNIIVEGENEVYVDKKLSINVKVEPEIIKSPVIWESSNEEILSVSPGSVYGVSVGEAYLILRCEEFERKVKITVLPTPTSIIIKGKSDISVGKVEGFSYNIDEEVILSSSNPNIVKVYDKTIIGVKEGTATVTAYRKDKPSVLGTIEINVKKNKTISDMTSEEQKIISDKINSMSLEQLIGQMFMIQFSANTNWRDYTVPVDNKTGLPRAQFGSEILNIEDFMKNYPIGNFSIDEFSGFDQNNLLKTCRYLKELGYKNSGINPFIAINFKNNFKALNTIPSNMALASSNNSNALYGVSDLLGKEFNAFGINTVLNNYANYNTDYNNKENLFGNDIDAAASYSYIISRGFNNHNVIHVPVIAADYYNSDKRNAYDVYNHDYVLMKDAIINGASIISVPYTVYEDINQNKLTYNDSEFMIDLIRKDLGFDGVLMADLSSTDQYLNYLDQPSTLVETINLGLDLMNVKIIFTGLTNWGNYFKNMALRVLSLYDIILTSCKNGDISIDRIKEANERILLTKLRNGILDKQPDVERFNFEKNKQEISKITPNFISTIGDCCTIDYEKSTLFISEIADITNTNKSAGEFFKGYFEKRGYKDSLVYHTKTLEVNVVKEAARNRDRVFICLSDINDSMPVGYGSKHNFMEFIEELVRVNPNVCVIVLGGNYIVDRLPFVKNFIVTYNYYEDDFENISKVMSGEVKGNKNYLG